MTQESISLPTAKSDPALSLAWVPVPEDNPAYGVIFHMWVDERPSVGLTSADEAADRDDPL